MTDPGKSFWHTAPGLITAVAALITAVGGLLAVLVQNDIIGRPGQEASRAADGTPGRGPADPVEAGAPVTSDGGGTLIPWARSTATLVRQDGSSATVKAPTVGLACGTGSVVFKNGQLVDLELVRSIRFGTIYMANSTADGVVTLLDGREMTEPIHTRNCPVTGANELGPLEIPLPHIQRIDFHR